MPLGYPTGLPGFGADYATVHAKSGTRSDATQLTSYVNRVKYDGSLSTCAVVLPLGSPGTIVWVLADLLPIPTPGMIPVLAAGPGTVLQVGPGGEVLQTGPATAGGQAPTSPSPLIIWSSSPDMIFYDFDPGSMAPNIVQAVEVPSGSVGLFIAVRPEFNEVGEHFMAVGVRWRFLMLAGPTGPPAPVPQSFF